MSERSKKELLLLLIPFMLIGALWGVNWRKWHPSPTPEDEQVRQLLASADSVKVEVSQYKRWVNGDHDYLPIYSAHLDPQEMQPVIKDFNLVDIALSGKYQDDPVLVTFDCYNRGELLGQIGGFGRAYSHDYFVADPHPTVHATNLDSVTASRCRQIIKQHPEIVKALIAAGGSL